MFLNQMKPFAPISLAFWSIDLILLLLASNSLWFEPIRAASALGNETDYLALLKLKESVLSDPYEILTFWNSSSHFCNWPGIACGSKHQRVIELNLQGYRLKGTLPPHVGNLSFLRNLNLQNNSFYGNIPQELGRLFRLQQLALTNNTFSGEIPTNLTSCNELSLLRLSGNNLIGKIPMEIGSLRKLTGLYIAVNNLTGSIPASIGNLSSLTVLSIAANNLEGNLPQEIGLLRNLTFMSIVSNKLSGMLPSSLYNLSSLAVISAAANQFNGSLPANMFLTLSSLKMFGIGMNQFTGPIPSSITNTSVLQLFDIPINRFVGQVPSLGNLQDLWWLDLSANHLGNNSDSDLDFITSLTNCSNLEYLVLNLNNLGGHLPNSLGNLSTQLSRLYLGNNQIYGTVPATIGNLINLIALDLGNNHFVESIPVTFGMLQKLQVLTLSVNKLSGMIPTSIGNLSKLSQLDLSQNMLEGNIPPSVGNCKNLQYLDLSKNNLSGVIPIEIMGLSSLSILLNLSQNSLSGSLPAEVGRLRNVGKLDISENHLSGDIPGTIGDCISLEYLYLQGNSFNGIIPSSLASLRGLRFLDLSRNNLSGSIPEGLQDIPDFEYLNLSFNTLNGEVPKEGVFRNASAIFVTGNTNLCGGFSELHLPPCPIKAQKHKNDQAWKLIVVTVCVAVCFLLLSISVAVCWMRKTNRIPLSSSTSLTVDKLFKISYQKLHQATNGFSASNMVGSGSFGVVYRGILESEYRVVAIKVFNLEKKGAHKSFIAECNALKTIRHRNLVKILTCCSSLDYKGQEFKALVFDYISNGSLEKWLHPEADQQRILDLLQMLAIVMDVASAIRYLHHECEPPVIHCDLKPCNVLLDDDMSAHVCDFGLARVLSTIKGISHTQTSTIGIKGTVGYAPPEYGMGGEVTTRGDVYSFGILVLEMLTGKRPTDEMFTAGVNLHSYVKQAWPHKLMQIVDPTLFEREIEHAEAEEADYTSDHGYDRIEGREQQSRDKVQECLLSLFRIGLACSAESPKDRKNMADVTRELDEIKYAFISNGTNAERPHITIQRDHAR